MCQAHLETWEGEDESDFNEGGRERGFKKANATK
jgi:hypothetical protein